MARAQMQVSNHFLSALRRLLLDWPPASILMIHCLLKQKGAAKFDFLIMNQDKSLPLYDPPCHIFDLQLAMKNLDSSALINVA